ncbi:MAG: hypothetical protein R6U36_10765 [Candidatus Fermentibacteraceae bacterium]
MEESRRKILEMLSTGKITVDEATALLERLGEEGETPEPASGGEKREGGMPRYLRVVVDSNDGDKVNVRVPLSLIRTGIKLKALIPQNAADAISEKGFDFSNLSKLDLDELVNALKELKVDVDSADGEKVRVFTE